MKNILGVGNALVDIMTQLENDNFLTDNNLAKGSMQLVDGEKSNQLQKDSDALIKKLTSGGSAANTIRSLARLGAPTAYIGKTGKDTLGNFFENEMIQYGVQAHMLHTDTATGSAIALVSKDGERTFATHLGAAIEMCPEDLIEQHFLNTEIVYLEGYLVQNHALMERAGKISKQSGLALALDLASYNIVEAERDFLLSYLRNYVDIVFANEEEAASMFPGLSPKAALQELADICKIAVVKIGKQGALIISGEDNFAVPAKDANVIDTTGAGDNFAAGFLYGYLKNYPLNRCAEIGSLLAANVIEVVGTTMDEERWEKILTELKSITPQ